MADQRVVHEAGPGGVELEVGAGHLGLGERGRRGAGQPPLTGGGVRAQGRVEHPRVLRVDRRLDRAEQLTARIPHRGIDPQPLAHPGGERGEGGVVGVVDRVPVRAGGEHVRHPDGVVVFLTTVQLVERLLLGVAQRLLGESVVDGRLEPLCGGDDGAEVVVGHEGRVERGVDRVAGDDLVRVQAGIAQGGHPHAHRGASELRLELSGAGGQTAVVVADGLDDEHVEARQEFRDVSDIVRGPLEGRGNAYGVNSKGACQEHADRLRLAVAHHDAERSIIAPGQSGVEAVEVGVVAGASGNAHACILSAPLRRPEFAGRPRCDNRP